MSESERVSIPQGVHRRCTWLRTAFHDVFHSFATLHRCIILGILKSMNTHSCQKSYFILSRLIIRQRAFQSSIFGLNT